MQEEKSNIPKAIEQFKERLKITDYRNDVPEYYEAMELAVQVLEEKERGEKKKAIPIATDISRWNNCTEVAYKCACCGQSFRTLGTHEKFCHACGTEVNWDAVSTTLPTPFCGDYEEEQKLIAKINRKNQNDK